MFRCKIIYFETNLSPDAFSAGLVRHGFNNTENRGVRVNDVEKSAVYGTYFEKFNVTESFLHPIDGPTEVARPIYLSTDFVLHYKTSTLRIINKTQRLAALLTFLAVNCELKITTRDCTIDINNFCKFAKNYFDMFRIKTATFNSFTISNSAKVKLTITSKLDAIGELDNVIFPIPNAPNKVSFEALRHNEKIRGDVSSSGTILLYSHNAHEFIDLLISNGEILTA